MPLTAGVRLGAYEIVDLLGAGGMGEVYRARDARLGREVAIKVLPTAFSADPDRLHRFEQEARAAAALNHPNVLGVFDIGSHDGAPYVVCELLEGATLRERLHGSALPVRKAIEIGVQIARGLAAAHTRGILHRDLKPENLFITTDGLAKILDFGLAKLVERGAGDGVSLLATTPAQTADGIVLGTIGYMSPEQARGRAVDHRSDIFSFGAVLYEMLGGRRAFAGDTAADTLGAILKEDPPDLPVSEKHIPPALVRIVDRCLEKSAAARFQSADDLAFALDALSSGFTGLQDAVREAPRFTPVRGWWPILAAFVVGVAATAAIGMLVGRGNGTVAPPIYRTTIALPAGVRIPPAMSTFGRIAISPDGSHLAIVAVDSSGRQMLWLRRLDDLAAHPLAGTEGGAYPFWSADSRSIGFLAGGKLKRVDVTGGSASTLAVAPFPAPGTWNRDNVIVFNAKTGAGVFRVSAGGGTPEPVTNIDPAKGEAGHSLPFFLPDGRHFLYTSGSLTRSIGVFVASLDPAEASIQLLDTGSNAQYAQGHLLFLRDNVLVAQPFDPERLTLSGEPRPIAESITAQSGTDNASFGAFSVSTAGVVVYDVGDVREAFRLTWFDRAGREIATIGDAGNFTSASLSADGRRATVTLPEPNRSTSDIWIVDLARGVRNRLTGPEGNEQAPVWTPDGARVIFMSRRSGDPQYAVYGRSATGTGTEERLLSDGAINLPTSVSPDGKFLLLTRRASPTPGVSLDIWLMRLDGNRTARPFIEAPGHEADARFSPDGRWVAYESDASGRTEIWLTPFADPSSKWQVSTAGGAAPRWGAGASELLFRTPDRQLMAVSLKTDVTPPEIGPPSSLFTVPVGPGFANPYEPAADAQRFLVISRPARSQEAAASALTLLVNWRSLLDRAR
jgi:Tol biopolymer transport system component